MTASNPTLTSQDKQKSPAEIDTTKQPFGKPDSPLPLTPAEIIADYRLAFRSRRASLIGRREALNGRAKFGIFGDGKEVAQVALARTFRPGDFRSGYYRDQTLGFALEICTFPQFFAQLYAHADVDAEPSSAGRGMNAHIASRWLDGQGEWLIQRQLHNSAGDISPTGSQMPRLVGLGYASRLYRELDELTQYAEFSNNGDEVAFGTIGNASCAEGMFWESINAIGILGGAVVLSIWDDGYGISVPGKHQIVKDDLSAVLQGFAQQPGKTGGFDLYQVPGWNYVALLETYAKATKTARANHLPAIIHVTELTQPQGHSTSGSHERYKSEARLAWEKEWDCLAQMRSWMLKSGIVDQFSLEEMEREDNAFVEEARQQAWEAFTAPIKREAEEVAGIIETITPYASDKNALQKIGRNLQRQHVPSRRAIMAAIQQTLAATHADQAAGKAALRGWRDKQNGINQERYSSHLHSQSNGSLLQTPEIKANFSTDSPQMPGYSILNACFDAMLARDSRVIAFGEDVGKLGGVNQTMAGLQAKYGELRVSDTGIRETTIIGQAIGMAMRGLRPIAEIQYLDYLLYALQILSDDLATLHWRTKGGQKAPVIIRTRGHRLEGIWHAGSPMGAVVHLLRGIHVGVPRNMTQAAGMYNALLLSDEPGLVVEPLNGYRLKERLPDNIGVFTVPFGIPEILREGEDITVVTYGACCRIALDAAAQLEQVGIEAEIIDAQTLLPFDRQGRILQSLQKTSRIIFMDEDVPGGASAYMLQQAIEKWGGYHWLDSEPRTLTAQPHRTAYGSDGDYWSKPNIEQLFALVYDIMRESDPSSYPAID